MGFFGALGNIVGGLAGGVQRGVRGLGRLARGHFGEGINDLGSAASTAAMPVGFLNPGAGAALAALGGLAQRATGPDPMDMSVTPANMRNPGLPSLAGFQMPGGGGGAPTAIHQQPGLLGRIGGWLGGDQTTSDALVRLATLLAGGASVLDRRGQRKSHEEFAQQRLATLTEALAKGEARADRKQPLGDAALASLQAFLQEPGMLASQVR